VILFVLFWVVDKADVSWMLKSLLSAGYNSIAACLTGERVDYYQNSRAGLSGWVYRYDAFFTLVAAHSFAAGGCGVEVYSIVPGCLPGVLLAAGG
jgi:hypothetical protein